MEGTRTRIKQLLFEKKISVSSLCGGNGTPLQSRVNRQVNGSAPITIETIKLILTTYPNLSPDWLLFGIEPMLRVEDTAHVQKVEISSMSGGTAVAGTINHAQTADIQKDETIKRQEEMIEQLLELSRNLSRQILSTPK